MERALFAASRGFCGFCGRPEAVIAANKWPLWHGPPLYKSSLPWCLIPVKNAKKEHSEEYGNVEVTGVNFVDWRFFFSFFFVEANF